MRPRSQRLPIEPLFQAIAAKHGLILDAESCRHPDNLSAVRVAALLGVHLREVERWKKDGLRVERAHDIADRAGVIVWSVWPELVELETAAVTRVCEASDCDESFVPSNGRQRFCRVTCAKRASRQRRYKDPEVRAKNQAARRRHYEECRDYELAYMRRYHEVNRERILEQKRERYRTGRAA